MRQELDEQNERAKKAAMSIVSSQKAEFKEEKVKLRLLERKKTWKKKLNLIKKNSDISLLSKMYLVLNSYFPCRKVTMS